MMTYTPQYDDPDRTISAQDGLGSTDEYPAYGQGSPMQPLPAYAPPLVAHHPEPRLKGRWWMVAAATLLGLVVAIGALHGRSTRVSSVGLFGTGKGTVEEAVVTTPAAEEPEFTAPPSVEEPQPEEATPGGGKLSDLGGSPSAEEPSGRQENATGDTYSFSWRDENGGDWGYEYTAPSDPQTGEGESYRFTWPDEQGGERGHEFSYRHEGDSFTFEYDGEEYSLGLEDLEWLLDPGEGYADLYGYGYDEGPDDLGAYGDLQMPGYDDGSYGSQMPGHGGSFGTW